MDRDHVGGRWSDGALWPLGLGTEGLWSGPASSSPVSGTRGPLPGGGWVETPPGGGEEAGVGREGDGQQMRGQTLSPTPPRDPAAGTPIPRAPLRHAPRFLPFTRKKHKSYNEQSPSHIPAPRLGLAPLWLPNSQGLARGYYQLFYSRNGVKWLIHVC